MIFIDRSIPRSVAAALKAVRDDVIWHDDVFAPTTRDDEWLQRAGSEGWIVFTRDKRIRHRRGERTALRRHNVACFILGARRNLTRWEQLHAIVRVLDEAVEIAAHSPRPFIYVIDARGRLTHRSS